MNKKGSFSKQTALGIALLFAGLIFAVQDNLLIGIGMMGIGVLLIATEK
ncbi:hypothetical protein J4425_02745 [Candidatus Woesearchaeota archaeon]|nr:hypothetical protein [Candidatus Woesearchaeota archaeon]